MTARAAACCDVAGCHRSEPVTLYRGLSGRIYAVTLRAVIRHGSTVGKTVRPAERHDITAQLAEFIRANPDWARAQLADVDRARAESWPPLFTDTTGSLLPKARP